MNVIFLLINYIVQLKNINATILNTSNWLNASLISIDKIIERIKSMPFVLSVTKAGKNDVEYGNCGNY
jgi:hypothetical protein